MLHAITAPEESYPPESSSSVSVSPLDELKKIMGGQLWQVYQNAFERYKVVSDDIAFQNLALFISLLRPSAGLAKSISILDYLIEQNPPRMLKQKLYYYQAIFLHANKEYNRAVISLLRAGELGHFATGIKELVLKYQLEAMGALDSNNLLADMNLSANVCYEIGQKKYSERNYTDAYASFSMAITLKLSKKVPGEYYHARGLTCMALELWMYAEEDLEKAKSKGYKDKDENLEKVKDIRKEISKEDFIRREHKPESKTNAGIIVVHPKKSHDPKSSTMLSSSSVQLTTPQVKQPSITAPSHASQIEQQAPTSSKCLDCWVL
jgi:tetratricopeptide (TPR) repeat protein